VLVSFPVSVQLFWFAKYWNMPYCNSLMFSVQVCTMKLQAALGLALELNFLMLLNTIILLWSFVVN